MKTGKKPLVADQQKKVLIPIITAALFLVLLFSIANRSFTEIRNIQSRLSEATRKEKVIVKLQELKVTEDELLKAFPRIEAKNDIIREIAGWGRMQGLEVSEIDPKESEILNTHFRQLVFTITGKGGFLPMMRFLRKIETSSYFVLASGLQLSGYELQRSSARFSGQSNELINKAFKVTINVFLLE